MSTYPLFYDSVDHDRVYNADDFADWLKKFFTTGVFMGELAVSANGGMSVAVSAGYCNINGKVQNFAGTQLTLAAAESNLYRMDTIVIERNDTDRDFYLKAVTGITASSASAAAPTAPVRTGTVYQIVLAQILVAPGVTAIYDADITDKRSNSAVCGIVAGTVEQMDFSAFEAQFQDWFDRVKDTLSEDAAGNLLALINALTTRVTTAEGNIDDLEDLVGSASMGTTATTVTGAIAELNAGKSPMIKLKVASVTFNANATYGWVIIPLNINGTIIGIVEAGFSGSGGTSLDVRGWSASNPVQCYLYYRNASGVATTNTTATVRVAYIEA